MPFQRGDMFLPWYGLVTHLALGTGSGFLVLAVIAPDRGPRPSLWLRLMRGSVLVWAGTISYGVYLWHVVVLELISRGPHARTLAGALLLWLAVLGGAIVLGAASWYLVERPLQRKIGAFQRRADSGLRAGQTSDLDAGVQSIGNGLNPAGVAVDHLA
jgi:peptidoglycan/LPS O-acetylase OafA/YrhL